MCVCVWCACGEAGSHSPFVGVRGDDVGLAVQKVWDRGVDVVAIAVVLQRPTILFEAEQEETLSGGIRLALTLDRPPCGSK